MESNNLGRIYPTNILKTCHVPGSMIADQLYYHDEQNMFPVLEMFSSADDEEDTKYVINYEFTKGSQNRNKLSLELSRTKHFESRADEQEFIGYGNKGGKPGDGKGPTLCVQHVLSNMWTFPVVYSDCCMPWMHTDNEKIKSKCVNIAWILSQ